MVLCPIIPSVHAVSIDDDIIRDQFGKPIEAMNNSGTSPYTSVAYRSQGFGEIRIAFSSYNNDTGEEVFVASWDGSIVGGFEQGTQTNTVAFSPNGTYLAFGGNGQNFTIFNVITSLKQYEYPNPPGLGAPVTSLAFSPNGKYLAVGLASPPSGMAVQVFSTSDWSLLRTYSDSNAVVNSLDFSRNNTYLAIGLNQNTGTEVRVLYVDQSPMPVNSSFEYGSTVRSVAFTRSDKDQLYISGWKNNQEAKLLNVSYANAQEIRNYNATGNNAYSISPSPDETKFALGCNDNKIHIFNTTTGKNFANFTAHTGIVNSVAWAQNGLSIASVGADGVLLIWMDSVPPVVTKVDVSPTPPINATKRNVTVTVDFNESMALWLPPYVAIGMPPNYNLTIINGSWLTPKRWHGNGTVPLGSSDGQNRVMVDDVRDITGNVMWPGHLSSEFYVDTIAPRSNASKLPQYMNKTKLNITAYANDSTMGVKEVELWFKNSSSAWTLSSIDTSPQWEFEFNATGDDVYAFETRARDFANNTEPFPVQNDTWTIVDTTSPISNVRPIAKVIDHWDVIVNADASDKNGIKEVELWYSKDGGAWTKYATDTSSPWQWDFNASGTGQGTYELASRAKDQAGNFEAFPTQNDTWVKIDFGLPETSIATLPLYSTNRKVGLDIGVQKDAGGIAYFEMWANDGSGWQKDGTTTSSAYTFNASKDGIFEFYSIGISMMNAKEVPPSKNDTFTTIDTVAPTVTMTSPKDGAIDVMLDSNITIAFSESMNTGSVSLTFENAKKPIQKSITWSADKVMTIDPNGDLQIGTLHYINITTGKDLAGNSMKNPYRFSFTTAEPPTITNTMPKNNSIDIPKNQSIMITFSREMNKVATESAISTSPSILGIFAWDASGRTVTWDPNVDLQADTKYSITIDVKARSKAGLYLQIPYIFSYTTAQIHDITPPYIVSTNPTNNQKEVDVNTKIAIVFNEAMNKTATENAISISPGSIVKKSWSNDSRVLSLTVSMEEGKSYTVTISSGAKDLAGNSLLYPYKFSFSTKNSPIITGNLTLGLIVFVVIVAIILLLVLIRMKKKGQPITKPELKLTTEVPEKIEEMKREPEITKKKPITKREEAMENIRKRRDRAKINKREDERGL